MSTLIEFKESFLSRLSAWHRVVLTAILGFIVATPALAITPPSFSLSSSSSSFTLLVGGTKASSTVSVSARNGFIGNVDLVPTGIPKGLTATFDHTTTTTKANLTITPGTAAVPGVYNMAVVGTSGTLTSTTLMKLTIPTPSFSLAASPSALTLLVGGGSANSVISVLNEVGLSNGNVNLTISGVPAGVTAKLNWPTASAATSVSLTAQASATAVPGVYPLTITGTSGNAKNTATVVLTIPTPSFSLSSSASALTLAPGSNGYNSRINISVINQVGLTGKVSLAVSGVPTGVTASLATVNATTESLTVNVGSTAAGGTYPVKITGTSGKATSSTTVALTIPGQTFTISSSASTLNLPIGGSGASSTISVTGQSGFNSNVALAVSGVPTGVTAAFSSASTSTNSTLTFIPGSAVVPGTYTVKVTGSYGTLASSVNIVLTIPAASSSFSLSSSAGSLTLLTGSSAATTINVINPSGTSNSVTLTAKWLPAGVTAAFSSVVTSTASTLTFTASNVVVPGTYAVTVTGTAGSSTSSTTVNLTIPVPSFSISSSATALTLSAGGASVGTTISVIGGSGLSAGVALTATGLPASVTANFGSVNTTTSTSLTFAAGSTVVPGAYTVTVTGTSGSNSASTSIQLDIPGSVSVAITQPTYGFNVLPGSVRRIFATVSNGITNGVNWSVTGGAKLSSPVGNWVDVTAPSAGTSCSIKGGVGSYSVASATQFILTAQSQENPLQTASITVNVCNPAVQLNVVPFYTTLYSGQKADIQAFIWGSVNHDVTWAITAEPNGGDGALADATNQDTVFSATVAGRYTLTATSVADGTKTNSATIFVTGNYMTYDVTPSVTEPVDCTVDPALTGKTYEVGPTQAYTTIQSVPWAALKAGSTVRIHNEDTTGGNPTTYHEYFLLTGQGTRTQPIRVCGVPDSRGNLPVIDASNSTTSSTYPSNLVGYGAVTVGQGGWGGDYTGTWTGPQNLILEGLKVQNARQPATLTTPAGVVKLWVHGAGCVRLFQSENAVVRGVDVNACSNGIFSDFNSAEGFAVVENTLYEGNHVHDNGEAGSSSYHQLYIQGWNEVVQFNVIDQYQSGATGSNFKGRGFPEIVRYNHFGDGAAREIDMVDNQDAQPYTTFEGYLSGTVSSYHSRNVTDVYSADMLAAAVEAHHADYVYGNTILNTTAGFPIHYSTDHGMLEGDRLGTLWFYNNSFYEPTNSYYSWNIFDTSGGGGNDFVEIEWTQIQAHNNAIWMDVANKPFFNWNARTAQFTVFGTNAINSNWGTGSMSGGNGTGWTNRVNIRGFQGASNSADNFGLSNLLGVSAQPFDTTTFVPYPVLVNAGTSLPAPVAKLPVRFQFGPSATPVVRTQPLTLGAME